MRGKRGNQPSFNAAKRGATFRPAAVGPKGVEGLSNGKWLTPRGGVKKSLNQNFSLSGNYIYLRKEYFKDEGKADYREKGPIWYVFHF